MRFASEESVKALKLWKELQAHYQALSASHYDEMQKMIDLLETTRLSWSKSTVECHRLTALNESLQRENDKVNAELRVSRDKHRESQAQIASLISKNRLLDNELEQYKKRFAHIKKIMREQCANMAAEVAMDRLKELPFLKEDVFQPCDNASLSPRNSQNSNTNTDELDYDRTADSFAEEMIESVPLRYNRAYQRRSRQSGTTRTDRATKRPSASQQSMVTRRVDNYIVEEEEGEFSSNNENFVTPQKRSRVQHVTGVESCVQPSRHSSRAKKSSVRRSISESNIFEVKTPTLRSQNALVQSTLEMPTPITGFHTNSWTKGRPIADCEHNFETVSFCVMATCAVCNKSFSNTRYKSLKCNDCGCYVHMNCRDKAPMPCVPHVKTPQKSQKRSRLADLCTSKWPKLPPVIVRCAIALEKKYINTIGLYRVPGSESAVKSLLSSFQTSIPPNLDKYDPEVICGCIKKILRELQDPLIPNSSYNEFVYAAEEKDIGKLMKAIDELPVPNRYTLAFLCNHWQVISHNSNVNQMPVENLAKCLGPTVFGAMPKFNCFQSTVRTNATQMSEAEAETRRQVEVLLQMLRMDQNYWRNILESPPVDGFGSTHRTLVRSARRPPVCGGGGGNGEIDANRSLLGPVTMTPTRAALIQPINQRNADRGVIFDPIY